MNNTTTDIRSQLRTLSIPKEQRPASPAYARRRSKGGWKVFLLLLLAGGGATGYWQREKIVSLAERVRSPAAEVKLFTVVNRQEPQPGPVLTATGKIVSDHRVQVVTKVSGQIVALHFEQGDRVKEGQLLAQIEDVLYRARRDEAAANLERSKARLAFEQINFERISKLYQGHSAPEIEYADAQRAVREAQAQVAANEATLDFAQKTLNDCKVAAPIGGVIMERNVEVGDFVAAEGGRGANANALFASIADMDVLRVEVDISELDIARIRKGMPCAIVPDAYKDRRYSGRVLWLDPGANYSKATVQAKVRIEAPDPFLRIEGSAQVAFLSDSNPAPGDDASAGMWIPNSAVLRRGQDSAAHVFVLVNGQLEKTAVDLGRSNGDHVEVRAGLREGQSIVARDVEHLTEGQRARS